MKTYKNSQITSTKCQYQEAASNPKWWDLVKWDKFNLNRHTSKNSVPIITCNPWNPVATKKVDPYTESAIENGDSLYSITCKSVNKTPKTTVNPSPMIDSLLSPLTILWWAQVTVTPELSKITVFSKGTEKGFKGSIPNGGHITPTSTEGDKLLWKNAQKKEKKKRISDTINKANPTFKPKTVTLVWYPWNVDSLTTSFNQKIIHRVVTNIPNKKRNSWL